MVTCPKPRRALSMKAAVKYADKWFSLYIRARDKKCVTCGGETRDCSHIFRRTSYATRWTEDNAVGQCGACHFRHHNHSEYVLHNWGLRKLGQDRMDELWAAAGTVSHFKASYIMGIGDYYKAEYEKLAGRE